MANPKHRQGSIQSTIQFFDRLDDNDKALLKRFEQERNIQLQKRISDLAKEEHSQTASQSSALQPVG